MPSIVSAAAGLMALSSLAAAFPQGGFANSTASGVSASNSTTSGANSTSPAANSTTPATTVPVTEALFCPQLDLSIIFSPSEVEYILECSTSHFGIIIDVVFNSTLFAKRQAAVAPANIQDCLAACDAVDGCVGTAFNDNLQTCTLYSSIGAAFAADGVDFAILNPTGPATTVPAGATLTSTLYATTVKTISSCAPTVTDCPLDAGAVVTEVIPVTSTDYICPSATVIPATPVACTCAYAASTATIYSTTTSNGAVTVVPVGTTVIAVPSPSGTTYSTTTITGTGAAVTTAPTTVAGAVATGTVTVASASVTGAAAAAASAAASASSAAAAASASAAASGTVYTGAAAQVKVAGGLGAMVAAAALLL